MIQCPSCCATEISPFLKKGEYHIVQCSSCQLFFVSPTPSSEQLTAFYDNPAYYTNAGLGYKDYFADERGSRRLAHRRLTQMKLFYSNQAQAFGSLIDLGCAAGFFIDEARIAGWEVSGTELSTVMRQHANEKLNLQVRPSLSDFNGRIFDALTMWEYIEHIPDPLDHLRSLHPFLKPGAIIGISTPNTSHRQIELDAPAWWEFKPPAHLNFFTPQSLNRLVTSTGYTVLDIQLHTTALPVTGNKLFSAISQWHRIVGDRINQKSPIWWSYSLIKKACLTAIARFGEDKSYCVGIDLYARFEGI
jgi:2-polyprenyl-3-methyl-5-hydroxy-6-metoxy-1,4-benzoquinol methylase